MNVLQIVGDSPRGGATYLLLEWCKHLLQQGCQVDVVSSDVRTLADLQTIGSLTLVRDIRIPREIRVAEDLKALAQLLRLMARRKYDVVHTYTATPGFLGRVAARLVGIPVILHHQAGWTVTEYSSTAQRLLYTPLEYAAALACTKGICVSHAVAYQARELRLAPAHKLVTICNGIAPEPFLSATCSDVRMSVRRELSIPETQLVIGNTGRLAPQKDNETLVRALVPLQRLLGNRQFTLLLVGDGPDRQALERVTASLGVSDRVRFLGFRDDVARILAAIDVFDSPSLREGLSISVLEAMAAARPIVTTSILTNAELIEHEVTGLLVSPRSPEQTAHAIARFAEEPALAERCGAEARKRVLEHYTLDRMFQETWDLYVSLLGRTERIQT